jgi:hypothetical protein
MHTFYRRAVGAGLGLLATAAFAEDAVTGWYVGVGAGAADYSDNIPQQIGAAYAGNTTFDLLGATTTDSTDMARQLFVGYRFTPVLGAEIGYQDLGNARTFYSLDSNQPVFDAVPLLLRGEYRVRDVNAALVVSWPVSASFELLARGGIAQTRMNYNEHGNDAGGNPYSFHARTRTRSNAQAGIGALWRFAPHFALRLDLDRTFDVGKTFALNADSNGRFDHIDAYTLNLVWKP